MALDKATLIASLTAAFADVTAGKTAAQAATQVADAIDVYVKSGATTRRYLGTIRITGTIGQCEDSILKRYVFNYHHSLARPMSAIEATNSWTYATATWRQANAASGNKVEYICGVSEALVAAEVLANALLINAYGTVGIGVDSTSANSARVSVGRAYNLATVRLGIQASYRGFPGVGYHYLAWLEHCSFGTATFYGDDGSTEMQSGITAEVWG